MKQFQLASAIFLKEFLRLVDLSSLNIESIDERIEQLKTQILLKQQFNGFIKEEENFNPFTEWSEQENLTQQKTKKKQTNQVKSNDKQCFQCGKCSKKFNHPSSLSRHKKNQHTNIKQDLLELKQLQIQQQEIVINLTDLQN